MTDKRREMGDWQTPGDFAAECCRLLRDHFGYFPQRIVEPTCGVGNFIAAARIYFPAARVDGIEINPTYVKEAKQRFCQDEMVRIIEGDYLKDEFSPINAENESLLVIGNPPWVTNSTLSSLGSKNLPKKSNIKGLRGFDAMTGESNFDICEWIILRSLKLVSRTSSGALAMLCKTSVARNVCVELAKSKLDVSCAIMHFDSKSVFGINAAACLLVCDFRSTRFEMYECDFADPCKKIELNLVGGHLRTVLPPDLLSLQGTSSLEWRQGVKHDCGKVMELSVGDGYYENKLGERVAIESEYVFPYIKSSKSRSYVIEDSPMAIPMTQKKIGEDTSHLESDAPLLWSYLQQHEDLFDGRKSSIYRKAPRFAMFGVGDYSYAPYKVGVSGFYKEPVFSLAVGEKPIMYDDTCYFLPFSDLGCARVCMLLLNSDHVLRYYSAIAFLDSKRPYSKKVLSQLDFAAAISSVSAGQLNAVAQRLGVSFRVSEEEVANFSRLVGPQTLFPLD